MTSLTGAQVSAPNAKVIAAAGPVGDAIGRALAAGGARLIDAKPDAEAGDLGVVVIVATEAAATSVAATTARQFSDRVGGPLRDAFLNLQSGVAAMRAKGGGGSIVFVAPPSGERAFDALRQGLRLMVKAAALELGPEGIRVNMVLPGAGPAPLGRACTPTDIADTVAFAACDGSRFMTGADLVVDGGRMAQ